MKKISLRSEFTSTLLDLAKGNRDILVVTTDSRGSAGLNRFFDELPEQAIEIGIAEQNSVGVSTGLASCGKRVFTCGPASFLSARSLEQVKVDVGYNNSNVVIIGVSGGISYGALGSTHHSLHDIAVMRTFPNIKVIIPSDAVQMREITKELARTEGPVYLRMGRNPVPVIYGDEEAFEIGKAKVLRDSGDVLIISCGELVSECLVACNELEDSGIHAMLLDMHTLKPFDYDALHKFAEKARLVVTVEEHSVFGGLGGAAAEYLSQHIPKKLIIKGIPDENTIAGKSSEVFMHYGLDGRSIAECIRKELL